MRLILLAMTVLAPAPLMSQQTSKLLLENDYVRVLEYPGKPDALQPSAVSYTLRNGNVVVFEVKKIDAKAVAPEADPFRNNPSTLKVLFENDSVRVMEATLPPGHKEKQHTHPPYAMYIMSDGTARFNYPDGTTRDVELKAGEARFSPATTHWAENTGTTELRIVLVELRHR